MQRVKEGNSIEFAQRRRSRSSQTKYTSNRRKDAVGLFRFIDAIAVLISCAEIFAIWRK